MGTAVCRVCVMLTWINDRVDGNVDGYNWIPDPTRLKSANIASDSSDQSVTALSPTAQYNNIIIV